MTEKQAYKILTNTPIRAKENHAEYSKALHIAIGALEKQIPKKPVVSGYEPNKLISSVSYTCPTCGSHIGRNIHRCYCDQALLWEGETE